MNTALQNRLVGTILVVALSVIFLPDLLDGEKQAQQDIQINIPKAPDPLSSKAPREVNIEAIKAQVSQPLVIENITPTDDETLAVEVKIDESTAANVEAGALVSEDKTDISASLENQTQILQADPQESAGWVIQLGSFRHQKNVRELINKLDKAGYRTFSRPVQTPSGELTKVFVGPEIDQEKLKSALPHLNEITKLKGRLTPFTIK